MSLHILLGSGSRRLGGDAVVIYCGPSGSAARAAEASATHEYIHRIDNPRDVVSKHNTRAAANLAALDPAAVQRRLEDEERRKLEAEQEAERLRTEARARAQARVKAEAVHDVAVGVVKGAIADVAQEAANAPDEDAAAHFGGRKRK